MPTISFYTLGCKVNQYETESLKELFIKNKYTVLDFDDVCDVYVVNSCTVTATGDKKTRRAVSRAKRTNPQAVVALIGCLAQRLTDTEKQSVGADIVLGNRNKNELLQLVEQHQKTDAVTDIMQCRTYIETPISGAYQNRSRGYIKIQDGCNRYCSYCIIPYVRGPVRSRSLENIREEAESLANNGIREVVLTGIQVGAYGDDLDKKISLIDAIEAAATPKNVLRVRLSSMEPLAITPDFLERCKATGKFCDSFHLSLQSGSNKILQAMNRRYTREQYLEKCNLIYAYFPNAAITTDIITGFPGETQADFADSYDLAKQCKLAKIHAFPYSPREGTKAASFSDLPPKAVRSDRTKQLILLSEQLHSDFVKRQYNQTHTVYFEKFEDGYNYGYTENYLYVRQKGDISRIGETSELVLDDSTYTTQIEE